MKLNIIGGILIALALSIFITIPFKFDGPVESYASFITGAFLFIGAITLFREARVNELKEMVGETNDYQEGYEVGFSAGKDKGKQEGVRSVKEQSDKAESIKAENVDLRTEIEGLKKENKTLEEQKDELKDLASGLREENNELKKKNSKLSGKVGSLSQKIKKYQGKGKK